MERNLKSVNELLEELTNASTECPVSMRDICSKAITLLNRILETSQDIPDAKNHPLKDCVQILNNPLSNPQQVYTDTVFALNLAQHSIQEWLRPETDK